MRIPPNLRIFKRGWIYLLGLLAAVLLILLFFDWMDPDYDLSTAPMRDDVTAG